MPSKFKYQIYALKKVRYNIIIYLIKIDPHIITYVT